MSTSRRCCRPTTRDAEGFDNNAEVLSVSTTLMERYLTAARRISQLAIGDPTATSRTHTYSVPQLENQDVRVSEDLPFGSRGGLTVRHHFPLDGEYEFKIDLRRNFYNYIRGLGNVPHRLDVRIDKKLVKTFMVGGDFEGARCATSYCGSGSGGFPEWGAYSVTADEALRLRVPVKAGMRLLGGRIRPPTGIGRRRSPASPEPRDVRVQHRWRSGWQPGRLQGHRAGTVRRADARRDREPAADPLLPTDRTRGRVGVRRGDPLRPGPPRLSASGVRPRHRGSPWLLRSGAAGRRVRIWDPGGAGVLADRPRVRVSGRARADDGRAARVRLPRHRPRAGLSTVVLPLGEHPR